MPHCLSISNVLLLVYTIRPIKLISFSQDKPHSSHGSMTDYWTISSLCVTLIPSLQYHLHFCDHNLLYPSFSSYTTTRHAKNKHVIHFPIVLLCASWLVGKCNYTTSNCIFIVYCGVDHWKKVYQYIIGYRKVI